MSAAPAPALSVVMPSFNQARFLGEAVRSVLEAPGLPVELVVMDGASTDGSQETLAGLAGEYPGRLRWLSVPDGGPAQAITAAVQRARAPLVGWLNSDDLYAPGAIARAAEHLVRHPADVMVYGHGEHVDVDGCFLEAYPTRPPSTPLADFADGCFICQPTAFFRRDAFLALGGLDLDLRASFDFDLWLRMFLAYPGRIGFVDTLQARTRMHEATITARQRERVALEGVRVIHRHLGPAPVHWLLTHFDELARQHPFHAEPRSLRSACERVADAAAPFVGRAGVEALQAALAEDRRLAITTPQIGIGIDADGWARAICDVRILQPERPIRRLRLAARIPRSAPAFLEADIHGPDGGQHTLTATGPGAFEIELPIGPEEQVPGARLVYRIRVPCPYVPAEAHPGNGDTRPLGFMIEGCEAIAG